MTIAPEIPDPGSRRRYATRPFPAYRYVPGVLPHPTRDSEGHSYQPEPRPNRHPPWQPEEWRQLDDWLFGVDLFNAAYFWEAHESWEGLWAAHDRASVPALFLQGLIQIAAALLKTHLQSPGGVRVLSAEGLAKLRRVAADRSTMMGIDLTRTIADLDSYFAPALRDSLPDLAAAPTLRLAIEEEEQQG